MDDRHLSFTLVHDSTHLRPNVDVERQSDAGRPSHTVETGEIMTTSCYISTGSAIKTRRSEINSHISPFGWCDIRMPRRPACRGPVPAAVREADGLSRINRSGQLPPVVCPWRPSSPARGESPADLQLEGEGGYRTSAVDLADWKNPAEIEFCYWVVWCHTRCKVASIRREGDRATVAMLQPHFTQARTKEGVQIDLPNYIENARKLLDEPGEWYLDRSTRTVYYLPRPDEDMRKAQVIAPAIEKLIELRGTLDRPVANISFAGVSFEWCLDEETGTVYSVRHRGCDQWPNSQRLNQGEVG